MSDPFESARRKLARGKEHIKDLEGELDTFFRSDPYGPIVEPHPELPGHIVKKIKLTKQLPETLADLVGDAAFNLRACLDHACYGTAIAGGCAAPKEAYFPFAGSSERFESNMKGRCKDISEQVYPFFRALQPYKGGNDLLWVRIPAKANTDSGGNANGIPGRRRTVLGA